MCSVCYALWSPCCPIWDAHPLPTHSMMMIMTLMNSGGDAVIGGNDDKHIHVILPCFYHTVNLVTIEVCIFPEEVPIMKRQRLPPKLVNRHLSFFVVWQMQKKLTPIAKYESDTWQIDHCYCRRYHQRQKTKWYLWLDITDKSKSLYNWIFVKSKFRWCIRQCIMLHVVPSQIVLMH